MTEPDSVGRAADVQYALLAETNPIDAGEDSATLVGAVLSTAH
jgi:hypothetical protein